MEKEKGEIVYCEWCGEFPYYISIHDESKTPNETLICKKCYDEMPKSEETP